MADNSISSIYRDVVALNNQALTILTALTDSFITDEDYICLNLTKSTTAACEFQIPSYSFIKKQLKQYDTRYEDIYNKMFGKNSKYDFLDPLKLPTTLVSEKPHVNLNSNVIKNFKVDFKHTFLDDLTFPRVMVDVDLSKALLNYSSKVLIKKITVNRLGFNQNNSQKIDGIVKNFSINYDHDTLIADLDTYAIDYKVDEIYSDVNPYIIKNNGEFDVAEITELPNARILKIYKNSYLSYDVDLKQYVTKKLSVGDTLSDKENNYLWTITSITETVAGDMVDKSYFEIELESKSGQEISNFQVGSTLLITSQLEGNRLFKTNVKVNDYYFIFAKNVDTNFNATNQKYGSGLFIDANELEYDNKKLPQYTIDFVRDFSKFFEQMIYDENVQSIRGVKPNKPYLTTDNFKIVQINEHLTKTEFTGLTNNSTIFSVIADRNRLTSEIADKKTTIAGLESELQSLLQIVPPNQTNIDDKNAEITLANTELSILIDTSIEKEREFIKLYQINKNVLEKYSQPKYKLIGFWGIPTPIDNQEIIQFKIRYKYLSNETTAKSFDLISPDDYKISFKENDSSTTYTTAYFSPYIEYYSNIKRREYDTLKNKFVWLPEDIDNFNTVNINQTSIPITFGEKVEVSIASVTEAGWPKTLIESDWSDSITLDFNTLAENNIALKDAFLLDQAIESFRNTVNYISLKDEMNTNYTQLKSDVLGTGGKLSIAEDTIRTLQTAILDINTNLRNQIMTEVQSNLTRRVSQIFRISKPASPATDYVNVGVLDYNSVSNAYKPEVYLNIDSLTSLPSYTFSSKLVTVTMITNNVTLLGDILLPGDPYLDRFELTPTTQFNVRKDINNLYQVDLHQNVINAMTDDNLVMVSWENYNR